MPIPAQGAFDHIAMGALDPFASFQEGNCYIIVFSDYYTRWLEAFALPSIEAPCITDLLVNESVAHNGAPCA